VKKLFKTSTNTCLMSVCVRHSLISGNNVRSGFVRVEKFVIYKGLTKNPEDYADKNTQPHVQVALRMKKMGMSIKTNDTIPYVICVADEGTVNANLIASRARHPEEVKKEGSTLKIGMTVSNSKIMNGISPIKSILPSVDCVSRLRRLTVVESQIVSVWTFQSIISVEGMERVMISRWISSSPLIVK
jgi:hypothetical protein